MSARLSNDSHFLFFIEETYISIAMSICYVNGTFSILTLIGKAARFKEMASPAVLYFTVKYAVRCLTFARFRIAASA